MNLSFYHLNNVYDESVMVQWDDTRIEHGPEVTCDVDPGHYRRRLRVGKLYVELPRLNLPDFCSTWISDYLVNERLVELIRNEQFTGVTLDEVEVTKVKSDREGVRNGPHLQEIRVSGWGGVANEESGIRLVGKCPGCGYIEYSELRKPKKLFNEAQWDGSDFFIIWPLVKFIFVTERVKESFEQNHITGAEFTPISKMERTGNTFSPGPLWWRFGRERAKQIGGPLGIE